MAANYSRVNKSATSTLRPRDNRMSVAKNERCRVNRTLYVVLIALASPPLGELEKLRWEHSCAALSNPQGEDEGTHRPASPSPTALARSALSAERPHHQAVGNDKRELARACERASVPKMNQRPPTHVCDVAEATGRRLGRCCPHDGAQLHRHGRPRLRPTRRGDLPPRHREDGGRCPLNNGGRPYNVPCHARLANAWRTWHRCHGAEICVGRRFR